MTGWTSIGRAACGPALLVALALGGLSAGLGCHSTDRGDKAPFTAEAPPAVYVAPAEPKQVVEPSESKPVIEKIEHIYGKDTYPCEGHEACERKPPEDHHLATTHGGAEYLDPNRANESEGMMIQLEMFEGLVVNGPTTGQPLPGAAYRVELSADETVYTFHLREEAKWSDGTPVTAHDFVYSWLRKLSPELGSRGAENLFFIKNAQDYNQGKIKDVSKVGVSAIDDKTLRVELKSPTPLFWVFLPTGHYGPVPRWAIEKHGKQWTRPENIVTSGPYHLEEWADRDKIVLRKSDTYWNKDNVRISKIIYFQSTNEQDAMRRYDLGDIHWQRTFPSIEAKKTLKEGRPDFFVDPYLCFYYYAFNVEKPPFDNRLVRRAIDMSIDKERLVSHVLGLMQKPATGPMPDFYAKTMGYEQPKGQGYDPEEGRRLLAEAGYPGGADLPEITLVYNTYEGHRLIAEFVQRSLKDNLGIEIKIENMEWKTLLKRLHARDYQMARSAWCAVPDPWDHFLVYWSQSENNYSGFKNAEFDALFEAALETTDPKVRMPLYAKAEEILNREMPATHLYHYTKAYLKVPALRGFEPSLQNKHPVRWMYWADQEAPEIPAPIEIERAKKPEQATTDAKPGPDRTQPVTDAMKLEHLYGSDKFPCEGHPVCDEKAPEDKVLATVIGSVEFLDPNLAAETEGFLVLRDTFEPLIVTGVTTGQPQPGAAERWEISEDGLTWTFHIRKDAKWSNGRPLVAGDFVYSWLRKLHPDTASKGAEFLWEIKGAKAFNQGKLKDPDKVGIKAIDDHTLEVVLDKPAPYFRLILESVHTAPVPREAIEAHGDKHWTLPENWVSNGPYVLKVWKPRDRIVLEKNPHFWNAENIKIPRVILYHSESETDATTRYRLGDIHWQRQMLPPEKIQTFIEEGRPDLFIDPFLCFYMYKFNVRKAPFNDVRVRRAINMAIDKERLTRHITRSMETPADGVIPEFYEATMGFQKPIGDKFDPEQARQLLADAGFPGGAGLDPIKLVYNTSERHRLVAEFAQRSLKDNLGIEIELENVEWKSLLKRAKAGEFDMMRSGWCAGADPHYHHIIFRSDSQNNDMGWKNRKFDAMHDQTLEETDHEKRMALFTQLEQILQQEMPVAPLYHYTKAYLKKPFLRGFEPELTDTHLIRYMYWPGQAAQ